jgi:cell division protease FtsH
MRDYSEAAAEEIDNEVRRILQTAYHRAKNILMENRDKLDRLASILIEHETLDRQQFEEVMEGKTPAGLGTFTPTPTPTGN